MQWHLLWPIEVNELQDVDSLSDVVVGKGLLHATVVPVGKAPLPTCCCYLCAPVTTLVRVVRSRAGLLAVNFCLAEVNAVKDVTGRVDSPL